MMKTAYLSIFAVALLAISGAMFRSGNPHSS